MGINPNFNNNDLNKLQKEIERQVFEKAIRGFYYLAEILITHAKEKVGYTDRFGHLRSSTGYILFVDGKVYKESYSGTSEGMLAGKDLAKEIKSTISNERIVLVITAGMNYALYVESKGYNVLTATENEAKIHARNILKDFMKSNL